MTNKKFWITLFALSCLGIYLFVSAPPALVEQKTQQKAISVEHMFTLLQAENSAARLIWTRDIVGAGKKVGLAFDEHWRDSDLEAGPLPALFLRETAKSLEKNPIRLSLFLGSDYPISPDNLFEGLQLIKFQALRKSKQAQFFHMSDINLQTAMFADIAIAEPCVECHNKHEQSQKHNWQMRDVMGAVTWMYPDATVSMGNILQALTALHQGIRDAYEAYLNKVNTFTEPPIIGEKWPRVGHYLPSLDVFMDAFLQSTAKQTLSALEQLSSETRNDQSKENNTHVSQ